MTAAPPDTAALLALLDRALDARAGEFNARHEAALRLFNGFIEGAPALAVDLYARTALIHDYADPAAGDAAAIPAVADWLLRCLPWLGAIVLKRRHAADPTERRGILLHGARADTWVREGGVRYAIDLTLGRDAGLYLDTRGLRAWARERLAGKAVLNTFAYTGSLGVAALAGGARRVVQLDRNRAVLNVAKTSCTLNGLPIVRGDYRSGDFFTEIARLKRAGELFDCAFVDPPFFSATRGGTVDLVAASHRPINRVRPLIADGGAIVAINNALFVSGAAWLATLEALCADGYLSVEELIPVPPDFAGYPQTRVGAPPADPAPFNHSTKIAVLRVRRKRDHGGA